VHKLLSSHNNAMAAAPLGSVEQPVVFKQIGCKQISSDWHEPDESVWLQTFW
jgi:hypothetical protein